MIQFLHYNNLHLNDKPGRNMWYFSVLNKVGDMELTCPHYFLIIIHLYYQEEKVLKNLEKSNFRILRYLTHKNNLIHLQTIVQFSSIPSS